ncbi:MAG: DUF3857 domain-containing protein [Bacteroidales bacterium]|jgi:hypothetical protein|nr:DUF3857 domain-containing protein [Bacteroidales bacterium]
MIKTKIALILLLGTCITSFATPRKKMYPVNEIPESLKEDAVAVIREHEEIFEIESISKAYRKVKHVITILDENGDNYAVFNEWYDKFRSIEKIQILLYDKEGNLMSRVKSNEIEDYCSFSSFSLYEDNRQKLFIPNVNSYPYTISISFVNNYRGLFTYPTWQPSIGYDISVQKSSFRIITPQDFRFRYKESNLGIESELGEQGNKLNYYWEVQSLGADESEDYSPYYYRTTGVLYTAPSDFSIDGYAGNMDTWENLGLWQYSLLEGRDGLSDITKAQVKEIMDDASSKRDLVKKIYKYMQSRTRYVSIQEGIGGWQPFSSLQVDTDGYGDCKALSNYTMVLLKEAGIASFYTSVKAGRAIPDIQADFVSNQSNHVFLCVPLDSDTIWLECTSQVTPFGYIGNSTDDRHVLLVTPDGGKLVKSRTYTKNENVKTHLAIVDLNYESGSDLEIRSTYRGLRYDIVAPLLTRSVEERMKWVYNNTAIENASISDFSISRNPGSDVVPEITTTLKMDVKNYGSVTGDRWFLPMNLLTRIGSESIPERNSNRRTDIMYRSSSTDIDSVYYKIPEGYVIESVPQSMETVTVFGSYSVTLDIIENQILYVRRRTMNKGCYPSSKYNDFRQFYIDMQKMDNCHVVLIKA